jgi:DNA-binding CsgD family transcriptional regulator
MQMLLDADVYAINWFGVEKILDVSYYAGRAGEVALENSRDILNSHLHEHPLLPIVDATRADGVPRANRWSDVITLRQFRQTGLYHDFYRLIPSNRQIGLALRINETAFLSLTFNRRGLDFHAVHERALEALSRYVGYVVRTMLAQAKLEDALALRELAVGGDAVIIVDESGTVLFATERAQRMLRDYFSAVKQGLPPELGGWLKRDPPAGARLSRQRPGGQLVCACGHPMPWPGATLDAILRGGARPARVRCLRFTEDRDSDDVLSFQSRGLTPREAEVLHWIAKGKRDEEIGLILGISTPTVNHHVQAVLRKLGAETRGGAALEAFERLKRSPTS